MSRVFLTVWLLLGIFIQAFIFWPQAAVPYELPRVWLIQRWIEGLVFIGLIVLFRHPKKQVISTKILATAIGFFITAVMASILGGNWPQSVWGNYYRGDGLITLTHFMALWLVLILVWDRSWPEKIIKTIGYSSLLISFWAIFWNFKLNVLHQWVPNWQGIIGVSFNQPVFLAGWLVVSLPALLYLPGFWKLIGLIVQIAAIILTQTWGGILGIFLFLSGWFLTVKHKKKCLAVLCIVVFLVMLGGLIIKTNYYLQSGMWTKTAEARERIIVKGFLSWSKRPFLGWGWANFGQAFQAIDWPEKYNRDVYVDKAHSGLLEILVATGIIGFLFYGIILVLMFRELNGYYLLIYCLWLIHSQTNVVSISEDLIFWLLLAIAAMQKKHGR